MGDKRGQVTIFIIVAIVIVVLIGGYFVLQNFDILSFGTDDPAGFVGGCLDEAIVDAEAGLLNGNGYWIRNTSATFFYRGERVPLLCGVGEFYYPCIVQEPNYVGQMREQIEEHVQKEFDKCLGDVKKDFFRRGYEVGGEDFDVKVNFNYGKINCVARGLLVLEKGDEKKSFETFEAEKVSAIYELGKAAQEIVNYESTFCEFDEIAWMGENRNIDVARFRAGDGTKVYTLTDVNSDNEIKFAVRTCLLPMGI